MSEQATKTCRKCGATKDLLEFSKDSKALSGLQSTCRLCKSTAMKEYYARNRQRADEWHLMRRYGLTPEQYMGLLEEQGHRCAICETDSTHPHARFSVDHCHNTGKVRGLLCNSCNTAIGHLKDSTALLRKAATYVEAAT